MRSTASWSVGSAPPMNKRLPRRPSISSWYCAASLGSTTPLGRRSRSTADKSSRGSASADDSVCAKSNADTAPDAITAPMKLILRSLADLARSSAALLPSLPACTSTRATPDSDDCGGSTRVSKIALRQLTAADHGMIQDQRLTVTPRSHSLRRQIAAKMSPNAGSADAGGRKKAPARGATCLCTPTRAANKLVGVRGFEPPASTSRT